MHFYFQASLKERTLKVKQSLVSLQLNISKKTQEALQVYAVHNLFYFCLDKENMRKLTGVFVGFLQEKRVEEVPRSEHTDLALFCG
jgi:hypothetical protein